MNNFTQLKLKEITFHKITGALFLFVLLLMNSVSFGQTTLLNENFGTTTAVLPTGWTSSNTTNGWNGSTASVSSTYPGFSAGANVLFAATGTNGATHTLTYNNNLSTVGYTGITVLWGARGTATFTGAVPFEWSSDGTNWNAVSYTQITYNASWALVNSGVRIALPAGAAGVSNLRFRWTGTSTNNGNFRIDDFTVQGTSGTTINSNAVTGNWSSGSSWVGGVAPTSSDNVVIVSGAIITMDTTTGGINTRNSNTTTTVNSGGTLATAVTYTNNGTTTINGTFQLNSGGWATGTNNLVYGSAGTLIFNAAYGANNGNYWPTTNGPFNVTVNSGCPLDLGFARTVAGLFQTSANINNPGNITANGTLQLNSGYGWSGTGNPVYGSASLLKYNSGGSPGRATEWTATSGTIGTTAGYPNNVQVSNNTTLNFANGGTGTYKANGTLTVDLGSSLYQNYSGGNAGLSVVSDVTINGNITLGTSSGDLTVGGNLTVGTSANFSTAGRAVFFNGTGTQTITKTGAGTVAFDYVIIDKTAGSVVLSSSPATDVTVNATAGNVLQLNNTGGLDLNGRTMTFNNSGGGIFVNGTRTIISTVAGGILAFTNYKFVANNAGTGSLTLAANVTVNLNTNGNLDFGKSGANYITTLNGTLSINSTTSCFVNTNPPIYGAAALLKYNSGGTYGRGLEWSTTTGAGYPNDVQVTNNTTLDIPNTAGTFATNLALARNLTTDIGSALYMDYGAGAASGSLTIGGNLSNAGSLSLGDATGGDLSLAGNWSNSGTFTANNRLVTFTGATPTLTGATTFAFLTLNCSTGLTLQASSPITVTQTLTFTNGKLTIGANNLTIASTGSISGADTSKYVVAASTGQLRRTVGASATLFAVGNTAYNPITFNNSGTSDVYGVRIANTAPAGANNTKTITRQWITTEAVAGGSNLSVVAQYNTGETGSGFNLATDTFIGHYNGSSYSQQVAATHAGSNPFTATSNTNLTPSDLTTGTQYFAIGRDNGLISVPFKYVVTAITPTSPTAGSGFSATVTVQDAYNANTTLSANSSFNLTSNGNAGAISGTTTGTINSGSSSVVVNGIILANAGTNVTITAANTSGVSVATPGTSATFTVLAAATQLYFVGVPSTGNVGVNLTSFTVEARRPDGVTVDNTFTGSVTIAKTSGTGNLVGTLNATAVAGVATFAAAQFDAASTFTITATSGSLIAATSGNIVVTLAPTVIAQFDFTNSPYINYTAKNANVGVTDFAISAGTLTTLVTTGSEFPNEPYVAGNGGGWTTTTQTGAKNFNFTVTANTGYVVEVTSFQFNALATAAGPSAISYDIAGGAATYTVNAPDTALVTVNQNTTGLTNLATIPVLIQGWLNNSRSSSGAGNFRIDDVVVKGYVTCKTPSLFTVGGGGAYCSGGTGVNVTLSGSESNINYQLKLNGNNQGSPIAGTGNILSFGLQTAAGTYTVVATNTNGTCNVSQAMTGSVVITIDATSVGGSVTGNTAVCSGSAGGLLTLSGHTGSVVRWESAVSPFTTWSPIVNTNDTYTSGVLTQTTQFRAVVQSGSCSEAFSSPVTITIATTTWSSTNGGEWDNGLPTATTTAVISYNYTSTVSFSACALTVNNNANVIVSPNHVISLNGAITVEAGSTFTLESNAVLLQGGTTNTNSGTVTVKRNSSPLYRLDYTLWTSPVASQNLFGFSPQTLTNRFYTYRESTNFYSTLDMYTNGLALSSSSTFQTGRGYLIRTPNNWVDVSTGTPASYPGSFNGVPNNGDITIPIDKTAGDPNTYGYNAVGNPYPSPISITTFLSDNSGLIGSTLWFWRKLNNINQTLPGQATTSYVTYSGGTFSSGAEVYYNIEPGQGFFVKANTAGSLQFKNTQREANNGRFFRTNSQTNTVGEGRLWLYLKNNDVEVGNLAIGYKDGATNDLDEIFDGAYINDSPLALTSLVDNKELSVQHRATPFTDADIVPLSFKTDVAGTFSIVFNDADGELTTQEVYLEDLLLGQIVPIKTTAYSFSSNAGVFADRFRIVYVDNALGIVTPSFNENQIVIYKNLQNDLVINSGSTVMSAVKIFDIKGRLLAERKEINAAETAVNVSLTNEVLLVQITSKEGVRVTKKVVK